MSSLQLRCNTTRTIRPTLRPLPLMIAMLLASAAPGAYAQEGETSAQPATTASATDSSALPQVRVTARTATESAKDVPFTVNVISGNDIEARRLTNVEEVLRATPGVNINSSGGANVSTIYIRGTGALYPMSMDDSSAAVMLDGSPVSARNISLGTLDIDQVEVMKGPQGTTYGAIADGGAVNITTRKPTRTLEGYLRGEVGQHSTRLLEGAVGGPLTERLSGRFAFRESGSDHWVRNAANNAPLSKPNDMAFRGSLLWNLTRDTDVLFTADHQEIKELDELLVLQPYGKPGIVDMTPGLLNDARKKVDRYAVNIEHRFENSRLTSNTAWTHTTNIAPVIYDQRLYQALYGAPGEFWNVDQSNERVTTQDFRWSSLPNAPFFWVTGLSFSHADRAYDTPRNTYGTSSAKYRHFSTNRTGVYGEVTYPVADRLKLTAGLRQSWDRKTYDARYMSGSVATPDNRSLSDRYTTGRVGLAYALTPTTNIYAMLSRGYNSGGFNDYAAQVADSAPYRASVTRSAEVGFKMESQDRQFQLNGALYLNKVKNNHLLSYDAFTFVTSALNADTRSRGAELQGTWRAAKGLDLTAGVSFTDATITSDVLGISSGDVHAGNRIPDVSRFGANLGVNYRHSLPEFLGLPAPVFNSRLNYQYIGKRAADPQNSFDMAAYSKVDLHLGISSGNTEVYFWANNLLNKQYDLYGYFSPPSTSYGAPARGRVLGVGATYAF